MALFTDGEPLSVEKFNDLASRLDKTEAILNNMTAAMDSFNKNKQLTVPVIFTNSKAFDLKIGKNTFPIDVGIGKYFDLDLGEVPRVVVSLRNTLSAGEQITCSIATITTAPTLHVISNVAKSQVDFNWIAVYNRVIPT
jgi:hypothetical protein